MADRPELLIVGGGPAGVSAALWARSRNVRALLLEERAMVGGTLHHMYFEPSDVLGIQGLTGAGLAAIYSRQLEDALPPPRLGVRIVSIDSGGGGASRVAVVTRDGERLEAAAVLIATGTRRRRLGVAGERELRDRGVSYSANRDREQLRGRAVAVAGGGDSAYENAVILASVGCDVTLIVRDAPRARPEFRERVRDIPGIRVLTHTQVTAIEGEAQVEALALQGPDGPARLPVQAIVIKAGEVPNSEWLGDFVARDAEGFVIVDGRQRTSRAGVWAAGDVVRPALPSIAVAAGAAALAVADARSELRRR